MSAIGAARLVIDASTTGLDFAAEVLGREGWVTIQQWRRRSTATGTQRRQVIIDSAKDHGWLIPEEGEWPRFTRAGRLVLVDAAPRSWLEAIAQVSRRRTLVLEEYAALDRAWRGIITAAASTGWVSMSEIGAAAGVGRHRIHQLHSGSSTPPQDVAAAAAQAARHAGLTAVPKTEEDRT